MINLIFLLSFWTTEVVTGDSNYIDSPLALDSLGNPYILISKVSSRSLLSLFYKESGNWIAETVSVESGDIGSYDLAISKDNRIWCIYSILFSTPAWYLVVAYKESGNWIKDTIGTRLPDQAACFFRSSIRTDSAGIPHIVYDSWAPYAPSTTCICYAFLNDSIWQKEIADSSERPFSISLDIDAQISPHIGYIGLVEDVLYARKIGNYWYHEVIDSSVFLPEAPASLRLNPTNGLPSIVYKIPYYEDVIYRHYDGTFWHTDTVHPAGAIYTSKALDFDSLGKPYFSYRAFSQGTYVAYKDSSGWHNISFPPVPPPFLKYESGDLCIGPDGTIHMIGIACDSNYSYYEVHYIYGRPEGIEEGERLRMDGKGFKLMVFPSVVMDNAWIQYTIPEKQFVCLSLYDILGRRVKTIAEGVVEPGTYSYRLGSSKFSSGVYFLILRGEKETICEKVQIIR